MPKVAEGSRRLRDTLVLRLFLAGWSQRQIGRHPQVRLAQSTVGEVIRREIALDGPHRDELARQARAIYVERTNALLRVHFPKALDGDVSAAELVRKILDRQARLDGLYDS